MKTATPSQIAANYGFTARHWVRQASSGLIPGATQPSGPGGHWLFDRRAFANWAKEQGIPARVEIEPSPKVRKPLRPPRAEDVVYVIYSCGHIKFGVSSNVTRRRHGFTTASPAPVHVLATIEGSFEDELKIHARFASARRVREWFKLTPEVREFVLECQRFGHGMVVLDWAEGDFKRWLAEVMA